MQTQALLKQAQVSTWIKPVDTELLFRQYLCDNSYIHQILHDSQIGYFEDSFINYIAIGCNLADIEDVEYYSNLTFTFDPEYEEILLHEIKVFRNGTWFDKLSDAKVDILQREEDLNKLVYDGQQTLSLILYDVRAGDLLSYSYSRKGRNPVFKSYFGRLEYINTRSEVYQSHILAAFDEENHKNLDIRYFNEEEKLKKEQTENYTLYELTTNNLKAVKVPDDAPKWYDPWNRIIFSNTKTWSEVNDWARTIYSDIYETEAPLNQLIEECRNHSQDVGKQIAYALFYVQEQIRYFADGSNLGGITPISPNRSLEMRFADCKNKVVILKSILDKLGVECYPVLVHSRDGELLLEQGASVAAFNHMIIQIIHNEEKYWFDATFTGQAGDIEHISQVDYGYALVLKEGETSLQSMKPNIEKGEIRVKQFYDLKTQNNTLRVITTYTDFHADRMRKRVKGRKIYDLQDNYISYFQKKYPKLQRKDSMLVEDDPTHNTISLTENYTLGNIWEYIDEEESFQAYFECDDLRDAFKVPDKGHRTAPFSMTYPANITEEREILLPFPYEDKITTKKEDNPFFSFEKQEKINNDKTILTQKYSYLAKTDLIKAEEIDTYIKNAVNIYVNYRIWNDDPYDDSGVKALEALPHDKHTVYIHAKQFYDLREKEIKLTVKTDYFAHEAFAIRKKVMPKNIEKLQEEFLDYYKARYEDVRLIKPYHVEDDQKSGKLTLVEEYSLGEAWKYDKENKGYAMIFYNDHLNSAFNIPDDTNAKEPHILSYPSYIVEEREIAFPYPYEVFMFNKTKENDFFFYEKKESMDNKENILKQKYIYHAKQKEITPSSLKKYVKDAAKIETHYVAWETHDPYNKKTSYLPTSWLGYIIFTLVGLQLMKMLTT